ncbi:MAG: phosphatase PAP2 family protein [Candidatus Woesearchaeota archaeon]
MKHTRKKIFEHKNIFDEIKKCDYHDKCNLLINTFLVLISFLMDKLVIQIISVLQHPIIFNIFYIITLLGESYVFIWIVLIIALILIMNKHPLKKFIITIIISSISIIILKTLINRPRPFEILQIKSTILTNMSSFPSGHTMMFFSIIPYLSQKFPKIKIGLWTLAILVGISRLYLGVHYFSDVVAGAIFGYLIGAIILKAGEKSV